jgi:putative phage-type endonuclease
MNTHDNIEQGTPEWHALRAEHFTASDAAAMMGESKYKSRNQLLEEKATGKTPEVSEAKQRIFDQGHEAEAAARDILEMETLESYPPLVATREIECLPLLASFDGCSLGSRGLWEHKLWNETLAENVRNKTLEPAYYWQLEHQLLVAGDEAQHVIFTVSDGTMEKRETMVYESVPERREKLIAGWHQFAADLANYKPKAKQEQVEGADADGFPLVEYEVHGTAIYSNLRDILPIVKERAKEEMARPLETDQDFADKEKQVKAVKAARKHLKETTEEVKGEFVSFAEFSSLAAEMDSVLQKLQSHGEKAVKDAKAQKKREIEQYAEEALAEYIGLTNEKIKPLRIERIIDIIPDWGAAMKNKRTLESLQNAVDEELSRVQVGIKQTFKLVWENLEYFNSQKDYHFLFNDLERIVNQQSEGFKALVQQRIADYEAEQKERREREERERKEREEAEVKRMEEAEARRKEQEEADAKRREEERAQEVKPEPEDTHEAPATNVQAPADMPVQAEDKQGEIFTIIDDIEEWSQKYNVNPDGLQELYAILRRHYGREAA